MRPRRCGFCLMRITVNVAQRREHGDARRGLRRTATHAHWSMIGIEKSGLNKRAVGLEDRQPQDDEAPEGEGVREARHGPLQQLALAQHLDGLCLDQVARVGQASGRARLAHPNEAEEHEHATTGNGEGGEGDQQANGQSGAHRTSRYQPQIAAARVVAAPVRAAS